MPWNKNDYPASMKNLTEPTRRKAIEIANALLEEGYEEGRAISIGISKAKEVTNTKNKSEDDITYHLVPHSGEWAIKKENSRRVTEVFQTKNEALVKGNDLVKRNNGRLVVHRQDGTIERVS
ncbi:hypothetical protein CJ195_03415 [Bacillus sp. UMB0899]|uniref:DUF2188 domain-containing protein n=1 Tax=Metabacillus schmidteae TaxID=2730405 RepID=UPI000C7FAE01|nr:DUF2188 domain-containing protein [Metabacillus schmidteae]PMC40839.1 hypothetical protein CJ195_03415 [Bacillus sp. UMB0899]